LSTTTTKGKHAEIGRRYRRQADRRGGGGGFRYAELRRLYRHRGVHEHQLANVIADLGNVYDWGPDTLGEAVQLTFIEQTKLGIRTFRCFDQPAAAVTAYYVEKRKERDRMRKHMERPAPPRAVNLSKRAQVIVNELSSDWMAVSALVEHVATNKVFCDRHGRKLEPAPLRTAVHRSINELVDADQIATDLRNGRNGLQALFVRRQSEGTQK
jgi:hypothetical protein